MADNTIMNATDTIATDDVTTLNGGASSGIKVQRAKVGYGDDGTYRDVSSAFPLPVWDPDGTASGTITATDAVLGTHNGTGAVLTGTPTANSYVVYALTGGESGFTMRLSGTFGGGTVWMESSVDSTNGVDGGWATNLVRQSGSDVTVLDTSITTPGIFRGVAAGYSYLRVRVTGATTPSITVAIRASSGPSVTAQVASLPPGANTIGNVGVQSSSFTPTSGTLTTSTVPTNPNTTSTTSAVVANVSTAGNVTVYLYGGTYSVLTLAFEVSPDGTNWFATNAARVDGSGIDINPSYTAATARGWEFAMPGVVYFRVRATAITQTVAPTVVIAPGGILYDPAPTVGLSSTQSLPMGVTTGTTVTTSGTVGRTVRANANVAQATAATLITAPATGSRIYVTNITCSNEGATLTVVRLFAGSLPAAAGAVAVVNDVYDFPIASSGGGATVNFPPNAPWALPLATALSFAVTVATTWDVSVSYYVAP